MAEDCQMTLSPRCGESDDGESAGVVEWSADGGDAKLVLSPAGTR